MGAQTSIAWTHHTFNPWWGCEKVSPGCANCYAETFAKRVGHRVWGKGAPRRFFGKDHWTEPLRWDAAACTAGERRRVFCSSMADVFEDRDDLFESRDRLFSLIEQTPHLDWLLLTKRPENVKRLAQHPPWMIGPSRSERLVLPDNVWLGTSVEDQERADERIPHLLAVPARVRFLSCEPLLGPVDLGRIGLGLWGSCGKCGGHRSRELSGCGGDQDNSSLVHWVIAGGESGPKARPCEVAWIRSLRDQCGAAGVAFFCKQLGARPVQPDPRVRDMRRPEWMGTTTLHLQSAKGADPAEWPEDLRVQKFPDNPRHVGAATTTKET